ncbi:MAG: methylated-DNA--[protein]-cysteine S-methyltransferase, partial [Verrucomicrobiales bacterium]|nr:methylated-DNA--[protein]-cysteine S-methyltransferase [Verrucomicrobiales bacterium]
VLIAAEPVSGRIVWISLLPDKRRKTQNTGLAELESHWQPATLQCGLKDCLSRKTGDWIFQEKQVGLMMRGTEFQVSVWKKLVKVPRGKTTTYSDLARQLKRPATHARAVGAAVAANTVAVLVPCHRVIGKNGNLSGFRWGVNRKRKLLDWEQDGIPNAVV